MKLDRTEWLDRRLAGWRDSAGRWTAGWVLFLTVTGLSVHLTSFSVFNQHALLWHTALGLLLLPPVLIYLVRHVRAYWHFPTTHVKFSGWTSGAALAVCVVSGLVLTWQAAAGTRITYVWRTAHALSTYALVPLLGAHLVWVWARARKRVEDEAEVAVATAGYGRLTVAGTFAGLGLVGVATALMRPVVFDNSFPEGYDLEPYAGATPFSPSLATTVGGGALDPRSLSGSASCGKSGCHEQIYEEWLPSAHRYASMDAGFQVIQGVMAQQNGADSTRYCGGCHDPISLFSGTKNIGVEDLTELSGYQEGISCLSCHSIKETDVKGNANYVMAQPDRYVFELSEGPVASFLSDFLLRAYPDHHVETLSHRMFKAPEFCAACHKQFIDEEVNEVGWVQLQNQYDNWKASRWHDPDDETKTLECRECHMPLQASFDPAAGDEADHNRDADDGKHRSHRFLGANQYIPLLMKLEGGEEQARLTEAWLRGEYEVPEIAERWREGPAVPIEIEVAEEIDEGDELAIRVHLINNKVGHDFPTGPLDIIQAWVDIEVVDANGHVLLRSGEMDEENRIDPGTFMFKAEPVDRYGNLIDRHNLWEMVGVRFKRSLFPGSEEVASYGVVCSGQPLKSPDPIEGSSTVELTPDLVGPLTISAKLKYRKFDQFLLDFAFGEEAGLTAPVTIMSEAEATVRLRPAGR
jgi:cytochrome c554/c'-like protein